MITTTRVRDVYVIQEMGEGLFLTESLGWSRSFKGAGRLYSADEAQETALWNCSGLPFEIHRFLEKVD